MNDEKVLIIALYMWNDEFQFYCNYLQILNQKQLKEMTIKSYANFFINNK